VRRVLLAALVALCVVAAAPGSAAAAGIEACTGDPDVVRRLDLTVGGQATYGSYATPSRAPRVLAVYGHGFSFNVDAWRRHLPRTARREGALALAMNYRGLRDLPPGPRDRYQRSRGWPVRAGGEDLVAAAQAALRACPTIRHVVLLGISMGGNATGLAAAARARRPDGRPLFDFWIGVEGVYNLVELYQGARALAPVNAFAAAAREDIEAETGGTPETQPAAYAERTVVNRARDIAASGLRGVVLVHGVEDGLAPFNQAQELTRALRGAGMPTDLFTVTRRSPGDDEDTTVSSYSGRRTDNAGHGPEWSENHIVIDTGFDRVAALVTRGDPAPCNRDFTVDGAASPTTSPDPAAPAPGCPRMAPLRGGGADGAGGGGGAGGSGGGPGAAVPGNDACFPRPRVVALRARARGRGLAVTGRIRVAPCARAGRPSVRVAVVRRAGRRCRSAGPSGRLGRPRPCTRLRFLRAAGSSSFRLLLPRRPRGALRVVVVASDRNGRGPRRVYLRR